MLTKGNKPKYAILNNDALVMIREDDFNERAELVSSLEDLSETFRKLNPDEHPAVKARLAAQQKEFEEEHKLDSETNTEEKQPPIQHLNGMPDEMIREKLVDGQQNKYGAKKVDDSVMDYISKNFLTEGKEGEEDDSDDQDWVDDMNIKDEL